MSAAASAASAAASSATVEVPASHRTAFRAVLSDLFFATHCHSCGEEFPVTLRGYVGRHCSRGCWHALLDEGHVDDDCIYGSECRSCTLLEVLSVARMGKRR